MNRIFFIKNDVFRIKMSYSALYDHANISKDGISSQCVIVSNHMFSYIIKRTSNDLWTWWWCLLSTTDIWQSIRTNSNFIIEFISDYHIPRVLRFNLFKQLNPKKEFVYISWWVRHGIYMFCNRNDMFAVSSYMAQQPDLYFVPWCNPHPFAFVFNKILISG